MDGADLGRFQQQLLPGQAGVPRLLLGKLPQPFCDALLHLPRGGVGKGHHQQAVGVHRLLPPGEQLHHPLHQHSGLAAAGGGGNQDAAPRAFNGLFLRFGPAVLAHASSSPSFFSLPEPISRQIRPPRLPQSRRKSQ